MSGLFLRPDRWFDWGVANDVSAELQLAFLNRAWIHAGEAANTLRDQLLVEQSQATELISLGSIGSVGKNSTSQSYAGYGPGKITQVQIAETWTTLIAFYDTVKAQMVTAFADASMTVPDGYDFDQPVYELLTKALNVSVTDIPAMPDIRDLRVPLSRTVTYEVAP